MAKWMTILACVALVTACGGGTAQQENASAPAVGGEPSAVPVAPAETVGPGGAAVGGQPCDYGGADRYTCGAGLECCYGAHATEDGYGSCQPECEGG